MKPANLSGIGLVTALLAASTAATAAELPSQQEMWEIIQKQQREIEALKAGQKETAEKAEAAVEVAEQSQESTTASSGWTENTRIGGYGELHYNNLDSKKEMDLHRVIMFLDHEFSDRIRFASEIEFEHDGDEVEVEQAYVEFDLNDSTQAKAGVFLVPAGILNETHEPATFYGVERNPVETNIIPTTWWVGGASLGGQIGDSGFSYDLAVHEGLKTSAANDYKVRKGRQKTIEADANDLAYTGRIRWTGLPGVELAATAQYQQDVTQGTDPAAGHAWLFEAHTRIERGPLALRALYAFWTLDGNGPDSIGADEQTGFYVEPSYRFSLFSQNLGVFARYNQWDNQAGSSRFDSGKKQYTAGLNYWPHPGVVLKADVQQQDNDGNQKNDNGFNLGVGYQF
ncbi:MAG TPA: porin [Gammaproteobacteria bacterium]|nr:porin [Gammaproteobacteria bacterium]